jgi:hypothetical protein
MLEVNSLIHHYKFSKFAILKSFELTLSKFTIILSEIDSLIPPDENTIYVNRRLVNFGLKTLGRLDIYIKSHIFKQLLFANSKLVKDDLSKEHMDSLNVMEKDLLKIIQAGETMPMTQERYMKYVEIFAERGKKKKDTIKEIKQLFKVYQNLCDDVSLKYCEKLFIQMLGHDEKELRDEAVRLLNMLYDGTNWQEKESFKSLAIHNAGNEFKLEIILRKQDFDEENIVLICNSPSYNFRVPLNVISWNPISSNEIININSQNYIRILIDLKDFTRCGFYDWNLVK